VCALGMTPKCLGVMENGEAVVSVCETIFFLTLHNLQMVVTTDTIVVNEHARQVVTYFWVMSRVHTCVLYHMSSGCESRGTRHAAVTRK